MADRFYSEGSKNNGAAGSDAGAKSPGQQKVNPYSKVPSGALGDFSENVSSNDSQKKGFASPTKKFEVHIKDFDDFAGMPEPPVAPKPPRPISQSNAPVRRTAPSNPSGAKKTVGVRQTSERPAAARSDKRVNKAEAAKKAQPPKATRAKKKQKASAGKRVLTPEQQERLRARKRYNFVKTALITAVCVFFISIMTVSASTIAMQFINDVLVIDKQGGSVNVEIPEGADFDEVFGILEENGLIKQKTLCYILLKLRDYDIMDYEPGVYYLDKDAGVEINIETIMVRKSGSKGTVRLTFPEGWTIAQIFEKIEKYEVCDADKLYANLDVVAKNYDFLKDIEVSSDRYLKYEGYLFPDTYDFYIEENPTSVLKKLFNNFQSKWTEELDQRAKELGLTVDEVINIAAMIQREAKDSSQMKTISSVIHNRLAASSTYPTLDMNSTKDYITSLEKYELFSDFYYELYLSSYNTYSAQGLPPGPICNPGITAIRAALYPDNTDYYFFMHSPSGQMYLARTASEHNKNTQLYLYD